MKFELQVTDKASDARTGIITTDHGQIKTPIFMPVGTVGSVKVFERFALGGAGSLGIGETDDASAKAIGCCLETELCTSRRLEEKGRYDLSLQQLPVRMLFKLLCHLQEIGDLLFREVCNRYKIMFFHLFLIVMF